MWHLTSQDDSDLLQRSASCNTETEQRDTAPLTVRLSPFQLSLDSEKWMPKGASYRRLLLQLTLARSSTVSSG